jgi:hypothetical protein
MIAKSRVHPAILPGRLGAAIINLRRRRTGRDRTTSQSRLRRVPHHRMTFSVTVQAGCDEKFRFFSWELP